MRALIDDALQLRAHRIDAGNGVVFYRVKLSRICKRHGTDDSRKLDGMEGSKSLHRTLQEIEAFLALVFEPGHNFSVFCSCDGGSG